MTVAVDTLISLNPATGEAVGEIAVTPPEEIPRLVERARRTQVEWGRRALEERADALRPAGQKLVDRSETLGTLLMREMGKPLAEAIGEIKYCGSGLNDELHEIAAALQPDSLEDKRTRSVVYHDPFGVCAAITPWNFPVGMPHPLVIPALIAGNAVILKPSEETPLVAQAYVDVLNESLPDGILTTVHGVDEQGKALVAADVDLIAFTGSRETGKNIMEAASGGLKRIILELGGKDPMIVLDDADLEKAAKFAVLNSFRNAGQVCVSTERIYVADAIADEFEKLMTQMTSKIKVGEGTEEGVKVGPMINARQREHVIRQVNTALEQGARLVTESREHPEHFIIPTVLTDLTEDMDIMREETFGPVACLSRFKSEDDAVRMANDTPFGLGAVVFGRDEARALEVARRLDAGMIGVNKSCGAASGAPWVGAKESGYGYHSSKGGHRQFTQARVVSIPKS
jgi:succinate-semialdehyde dehydrogenase/glutarate-semialdehyde dehydrogenase